MKKSMYSKPAVLVVNIKVANNILTGSTMEVSNTKVTKVLSREARFSEWDEDEE